MSAVLAPVAERRSLDVSAVLNYTRKTGVRPLSYTFDAPAGVPRYGGEEDPRTVRIRDARAVSGMNLDANGFELLHHRGTLTDWASFQSPDLVEAVDYAEAQAAIMAHTGADKVVIFDHTLRDSSARSGDTRLRKPVRRVHDDQTLLSAPKRVTKHLPGEEAAWRLQRRFAIINFWRPIGGPVLQAPLAVCDARTIEAGDLIPSDLVYPDWVGETYAVAFSPRHRWYWYPRQTPSEALLLKVYDSAEDGRARLTAHTAFDEPTGYLAAPARRSIELRTLVFW